jgi:hypothetical protein
MRRASVGALGLVALAVAGCRTESAKRKEVGECAAITLTVEAAATCLEVHYGWKKPAAVVAARAFQHQRDAIAQVQADSTWRADAAKHRRELEECRRDQSRSLLRCLQETYLWTEARAQATDDSLWRRDAAKHRDEVERCVRRRDMNTASCLQLYYQWNSERALAVADSIVRARMKRGP